MMHIHSSRLLHVNVLTTLHITWRHCGSECALQHHLYIYIISVGILKGLMVL